MRSLSQLVPESLRSSRTSECMGFPHHWLFTHVYGVGGEYRPMGCTASRATFDPRAPIRPESLTVVFWERHARARDTLSFYSAAAAAGYILCARFFPHPDVVSPSCAPTTRPCIYTASSGCSLSRLSVFLSQADSRVLLPLARVCARSRVCACVYVCARACCCSSRHTCPLFARGSLSRMGAQVCACVGARCRERVPPRTHRAFLRTPGLREFPPLFLSLYTPYYSLGAKSFSFSQAFSLPLLRLLSHAPPPLYARVSS